MVSPAEGGEDPQEGAQGLRDHRTPSQRRCDKAQMQSHWILVGWPASGQQDTDSWVTWAGHGKPAGAGIGLGAAEPSWQVLAPQSLGLG